MRYVALHDTEKCSVDTHRIQHKKPDAAIILSKT